MSQEYTRNPLMKGFREDWFVTSDGTHIRYLNKGHGTPLLMISGWMDTADFYSLNAPIFAEKYCVYTFDMRGHGFSVAQKGARLSRLAKDLYEFISALNVPKVNLLGFSMGCAILWDYIELFGLDLVDKLIFCDMTPCPRTLPNETPEERLSHNGILYDRWHMYNTVAKHPEAMEAAFNACLCRLDSCRLSPYLPEELPRELAASLASFPEDPPLQNEFLAKLMIEMQLRDFRSVFCRIDRPVLLLSGDWSYATTPESCEWIYKNIPDCTWSRFSKEDRGVHSIMKYNPEKFNRTVEEFLENDKPQGGVSSNE